MTSNKTEFSSQLKNEILKLMDGMMAFRKKYPKFDFPQVSENFKISRDLLSKGEFNLAVCGLVKNGKSSLINAMIGRELLPVCNDVATSRVFRISHAEEDKFYVIYANGNKKEISSADLASYGNQAVINTAGELDTERTIAYIQVYTPMDFLPEGVSLLDTPGIGSTYPQHTAITKQYLKMADAAVFVMNPTPLQNIEVDFLKEVADVTPGILFVTTKIDQNGIESVNESIKRNHQIIEKAIGNDIPFGIKILRMSSKLLLDSALEKDTEISTIKYDISGYDDVKQAIKDMVFMILGYYRSVVAYNACVEHYKEVIESLKLRQEKVSQAASEYEKVLKTYNDALAKFKLTMGDDKKNKLLQDVNTILTTMGVDFNNIFSANSEIVKKYNDEIDELTEYEISSYGEQLGSKIVSDVQEEWGNLTKLVQSRVGDLLLTFNEECMMTIPKNLISITHDGNTELTLKEVQIRDKIGKIRNEMFLASVPVGVLSTIASAAGYFFPTIMTPVAPVIVPILVFASLATVLWGVISGNKKANEETLKSNKAQLKQHVTSTLAYCRKQLADVSLADGKYQSLYQGFITTVREYVNNSLSNIYNMYNEELEAMKKAVIEAKKNPQLALALEGLVKEWSQNKDKIKEVHDKLESVKPD